MKALMAARRAARRIDTAIGRWAGPRRVLVDVRNPMHVGVLEPITAELAQDPGVAVTYTAERFPVVAEALARIAGPQFVTHAQAEWMRWDLYISADPWTRPPLRRCARSANVFHGVAGKYDLDDPSHLPIEFHAFDKVLFINRDRMERYLSNGIVSRSSAALVGFPKADRLVNGDYDAESTDGRSVSRPAAGRPSTPRPGRRRPRCTLPGKRSSPPSRTTAGTSSSSSIRCRSTVRRRSTAAGSTGARVSRRSNVRDALSTSRTPMRRRFWPRAT
jgi:hypothetical protein